MAEKINDSSRMGTMPEGKLLFTMAVPMMLSMLVQALYNIVDSIYVAQVSEDCLTALSLVFPAQNIMIGLATGTGVGVGTLISRALGAKDPRRAGKVAGNSLFLCVCCWLLMACFGIFFAQKFIYSQTADAAIREYALPYLRIVTIGSMFVYFEICFERLLQSTGQTKLSMWTQIIGAVTNIILDPFFIYGWCGLPAMGTAGAAIATVIGQAVGTGVGILFHIRRNKELKIIPADFIPDGSIIGPIYRIGFPSILMMCIGSVTNYMMNRILIAFTSTAVAVYGAYFKVQSFFFMPVFGLNNAVIPIIGYNYGAGNKERIYRTIKFGVMFAECSMMLGFIVFQTVPGLLLGIFKPSAEMLAIGTAAFRRIAVHFPLAAFCIIAGSTCQALDRSVFSFITSFMRQIVVLIPAAFLLARTGNVDNVWWCFPIAELMSLVVSTIALRSAIKLMEKKMALRGAK